MLGFLANAFKGWKSNRISEGTAQDVFRAVLQDFLPSVTPAYPRGETENRIRISSSYIPRTSLDSQEIIQLLRQCTSLSLEPQAHQLLDKLEKLANDEEPATVFKNVFLPLANEFSKTPTDKKQNALVQHVQSRAQLFTEDLVDLYVSRCVGPKPTLPGDWSRTKYGCGCMECLELDSFLINPVQRDIRINVKSRDRADHLIRRLPEIYLEDWRTHKPEYNTEVACTTSGFELLIYKTQLAWSKAAKHWEEDRDAAQKEFNRVLDDGNLKKRLKERLDELTHTHTREPTKETSEEPGNDAAGAPLQPRKRQRRLYNKERVSRRLGGQPPQQPESGETIL